MRISGSPFMVRRSSAWVGVQPAADGEQCLEHGSCYHSFWDTNPDIRLRQAEMNIRFIEEDPIQTGVLQSYADPVRRSLDWAVGKELKAGGLGHKLDFHCQAGVVPDFAALKALLSPLPPAPLVGPGNVPIFEETR
eukprot:Skav233552  [mRNA]  locus=scaffold563:324904:329424:+ [translate_table: standard]